MAGHRHTQSDRKKEREARCKKALPRGAKNAQVNKGAVRLTGPGPFFGLKQTGNQRPRVPNQEWTRTKRRRGKKWINLLMTDSAGLLWSKNKGRVWDRGAAACGDDFLWEKN